MKFPLLFFSVFLFSGISLRATDTLSVEQIRTMALQNSPLQQQKALAESQAALRQRSIQSNSLPRVQFGAQATWQSDVFGLPIDNPLFKVPEVPKDQYRLNIDISERLYDGGSDKYLRRKHELERDMTIAQADVDVFQVRELVTDLFFKTLLLQENEAILKAVLETLQARLRQTEAAVAGGVALRSQADQVRIQILQTEQQMAALRADQQSLKDVLAIWLGRQDTDFQLHTPLSNTQGATTNSPAVRPEYQFFDFQKQQLQLGQDMLRLQAQPRVELFAQAGLGRPNPFNFFETGFEPFGLIGLRAVWMPVDWGNRSRERQTLVLQSKMVESRQQAFDQRLEAASAKDRADVTKAQSLLAQDDAIILLQKDILRRAEAQLENGIMTTTDYLSQVNLLTQAQLTRKTHEIQALQAQEMLRAKRGLD